MNFLAHIYLSNNNDLIKIGNFMADGIRGKHYEHLPLEVQKGIILHRAIDTFTDAHPIFREGTKRLHEKYHHYAVKVTVASFIRNCIMVATVWLE
jgi:acyl carrier protein phosphodiesterase